ncbi:hypothetical protein Tco_1504723 [Tanacetum coccineum]
MSTPTFAETHNLVAFSEKPSESKGFEQIIDFLNAKPIKYALTVNPTKVIITEESIRRDLKFDDAEGTACLPNDTIFEEWARMSAKTTAWNEFSSTMASAIICLANNQKFNFSKYIFDHMVKHLEGGVKFLMFPRFLQVFLDKQVEGMAKHKEIYVISSHTKKIFANMRRQGQGFSRNVTPLFETMMVNAQEEVGEGSGLHTDSHHTPTNTQPSLSKSQKKIKPKRKQRQAAKVHSPSSEIPVEESIQTPSNDPLPSEEAKIAQAKEISKLKKRVKKLEKWRKSRPTGLRRLKKVGLSKQVESSEEKDSLGAQEDASKHGRSIKDIDQDAEIALVDESQGRMHDAYMFRVDDLEGNEVIVDVREKTVEKEVSTADLVTTAGEVVTAASVEDSAAPTTATTVDVDDELTLAKTLIAIKAAKPKVISTAITTLRTKVDEEVARKLEADMRAEMEEEEMIAREKDEANRAVIKEWDDVQAIIDADRQLAEQIQAQEREQLSIKERSKLLAKLIESRRKYFAAKRAEEIKNNPPTKAQQKSLISQRQKLAEQEQAKVADDDTAELKRCLEIVPEDDDDVAIEATPLSSKSPTIVDYKIYKEGKKSYFKDHRAGWKSHNILSILLETNLVLLVYKVTVVFNKVNAAKLRVTTAVRVSTAGWIKWLEDQDMRVNEIY